jgi:hypothetical protein
MTEEPTYLSGEAIRVGDVVLIGTWNGIVESIITEGCPQWSDYWKDETGEGVMLVGPQFGRLFNDFHDEDLVFVSRSDT